MEVVDNFRESNQEREILTEGLGETDTISNACLTIVVGLQHEEHWVLHESSPQSWCNHDKHPPKELGWCNSLGWRNDGQKSCEDHVSDVRKNT